jgi:hypothetical protein
MAKQKLTAAKVQKLFNEAIRKRDNGCINKGECSGNLECSHFYPVGGNSGIRFHPDNAHTQCSRHHFDHHNRDPLMYVRWMERYKPEVLEKLEIMRHNAIRYNQSTLREIKALCKSGDLDTLRELIESLHGY